jgi:phospholipase C
MHLRHSTLVAAFVSALLGGHPAGAQTSEAKLAKIAHIVIIFEENRSFDNLFGLFPGANGLAQADDAAVQVDRDGKPYEFLPPVRITYPQDKIDDRFPAQLPNAPFPIDRYVPRNIATGDLVHRFYQEQEQINGGKMNKFAAVSDAGGLDAKPQLSRLLMRVPMAAGPERCAATRGEPRCRRQDDP